jgi:adenylate kinase
MQVVQERLSDRIICSNKNCQLAYSTNPNSRFFPKNPQICDKCGSLLVKRPDDQPEVVAERLETYNRHERELLGFFAGCHYQVVDIAADKPAAVVFEELKRVLVV